MAGTTPVTIHDKVVFSSKGIGDSRALSTEEIHTSSVTNTNYFTTFLQTAYVALVIFK